MRNFGKYLTVLLVSAVFVGNAQALAPDTGPLNIGQNVEANLSGTPSEATLLTSSITEVLQNKLTLSGVTDVTRIKQLATKYIANLGSGLFNLLQQNEKKKNKVISYSRTIENCKVLEIPDENGAKKKVRLEDPAMIKKAFKRLFFQYPSKNNQTKYAYAQQGEQLKMDTTIEMFITAKEMQKELRGREIELWGEPLNFSDDNLDEKLSSVSMKDLSMMSQLRLYEICMATNEHCDIVKLSSCAGSDDQGGDNEGSGSGDNEDMVCFWNSAIKAEKLYDTIMIYNQYVIAMLAQYRSVMGISSIAKIKEAQDEAEGDNTSALEPSYYNYGNTVVSQKITAEAMFADMADESSAAKREVAKYKSVVEDPSDFAGGDFELSNGATGYSSVLGTRGEGFADLASIASAEEDLQRAEKIHSVLRRLPNYEDIYKNLNYMKEMHNISRKTVAQSSSCVMQMLTPFYEDPEEALFGPNGCSLEYDEKGLHTGRVICHYVNEKSFDDLSASRGLMDVACPDDAQSKCYLARIDDYIDSFDEEDIEEDEADEEENSSGDNERREKMDPVDAAKVGGILQYVVDLYRAAIDGNAVYDHEDTVLNIEAADNEGANYTAHVEISSDSENMEFDDKTRASKYMTISKPEEPEATDEPDPNKDELDQRKEAKLAELENGEEEEASSIYITQRDASDDPDEINEMKANIDEDDEAEAKAPDTKDGDSEDSMLADTQIEDILRWTIGKEVIGTIAYDLRCGLNNPSCTDIPERIHFSEPKSLFPPYWYDLKAFYGQYIDNKYENIKDYIRTVPDFVLLLNMMGISNVPMAKEVLEAYEKYENEQIQATLDKQDEMFRKIDRDYERKTELLQKQREEWVKKKEDYAAKLSKKNSEYNKMSREIKSAGLVEEVSRTAADANQRLYKEAGRDDVDPEKTPQTQRFNKLSEDSQEIAEVAQDKKEQAEQEAKDLEREIERCNEEIEELDEELAEAHRQYIRDLSDAEYVEMLRMRNAGEALRARRSNYDLSVLEINGQSINPATVFPFDLTAVLPLAGNFMTCMREKLIKMVEDRQGDINNAVKPEAGKGNIGWLKRRQSLYHADNYDGDEWHSVLVVHGELIDDFTKFNPAECGGLPAIPGILPTVNIFASICGDDGEKCKEPPIEFDLINDAAGTCNNIQEPKEGEKDAYFVGLIGQPRDLMAPYPIGCPTGHDSAIPLREVFHFSGDDINAISIFHKISEDDMSEDRGANKQMFFSRRMFLKELLGAPNTNINTTDNYIEGEDNAKTSILPRWWRYMLLPRTYVQRQFDLAKLIGVENGTAEERQNALRAQQEVRRSGLYPCRSYEYDMDGKPTGRTYLDSHERSTGVPIQYFIDINSDFHYGVPNTPLEKNTRGTDEHPVPLEARVTRHPEWLRYSTRLDAESAADKIKGVPECLVLQVRVEEPETGEGIKIYDREASAMIDNRQYDYVPPSADGTEISELSNIITYYREENTAFPPNLYGHVVIPHDEEACLEACHGDPVCIAATAVCQNEVLDSPLRLTLNDVFVRALYMPSENYGEEGEEEPTSRKDASLRVFFGKNQLGDYLEQIERMRISQTSLLNAEKKAKTTELELADVLKDAQFVFGEDFNMACKIDLDEFEVEDAAEAIEEFAACHSDDYNRLREKLQEEKDAAITLALNKLSEVKASTVSEDGDGSPLESINRRRTEIMRIAMLYQLDTPQYAKEKLGIEDYPGDLVMINGDECSFNGDELDCTEMDEKIKQAYADWKVVTETAKEQDKERINRLRQHLRPYCATYPRY